MTDFRELWQLNRKWRQWMAANSEFVTPDTIELLRYLRRETSEVSERLRDDNFLGLLRQLRDQATRAGDAEMRQRLSKHPRSNEAKLTVHEELGDALMLALTALPDFNGWGLIAETKTRDYDDETSMDDICHVASTCVMFILQDDSAWIWWLIDLMVAISRYPGMNVEAELRKCWHRLAWKHASKAMDSYPEELK